MSQSNKYWTLLKYWFVAFFVAMIIILCNIPGHKYFIEIGFLFTFIGVLIGFAITIFINITNQIEGIKSHLKLQLAQDPTLATVINQKRTGLNAVYEHVKDNIGFLFWSLLIVVFIAIITGLITPLSEYRMYWFCPLVKVCEWAAITKDAILFSVFLLCLLAIRDLIKLTLNMAQYIMDEN